MRDVYPSDRNNKGRSTVYSFLKPEGVESISTQLQDSSTRIVLKPLKQTKAQPKKHCVETVQNNRKSSTLPQNIKTQHKHLGQKHNT
jgi:folylpolyglutamate synthase/dihydropteroate synthase